MINIINNWKSYQVGSVGFKLVQFNFSHLHHVYISCKHMHSQINPSNSLLIHITHTAIEQVFKSTMAIVKFLMVPLLLFVLVSGLAESFEFNETELASEQSLWKLYERWSNHHTISRDLKEKHRRFSVFKENVNHVFTVNQMEKPYKLRLNKFADMSNYEFVNLYARSNISHYRKLYGSRRGGAGGFMYEQVTDLPPSIDWRERGAVNDIKEQGVCGIVSNSGYRPFLHL